MAFVFPEDKADFLAPNGVMYSWDGDKWRTKSFKVDVEGDSGLMASVQRVEDNLDLLQDTVGTGEYNRVGRPDLPGTLNEGEACFLQDGGAEATTFAEVENILLNKKGKGPYANFDDAKKGDYLLLQSAVDGDFGLYVIRNATSLDAFWDFGLEISSGKAVGTVPQIGEGIVVRTSRPTFTVAQDTPPDFSSTGQLWFDTNAHRLKVWDEEAQVFVETGGDGSDVHVGEDAPADPSEGGLWYDSTRLELFVYYVDGDGVGGWVPCSPLGARVEAGEIVQAQLVERVGELEKRDPDDYLKRSGGSMTGNIAMNGHTVSGLGNPNADAQAVNKRYVDTNFVPSAGGTFTGQLTVKYSDAEVPRFVVSNGDFHSFWVPPSHAAHCRGRVYVNSYYENDGGQTGDANKLATINEVKELAGGGKFFDNFDKGYTTTQGSQTSPIGFNTVALLDSSGLATKNFATISQLLMSWDQINPEWLTKTGHIKLTDEGSDVLRGYLTVLDYELSNGRNVALQVMPGKYGGNTSEIGYGKRLSLTFNGVFFGTYDPLWSPS